MAAISFSIGADPNLETVVAATSAPGAGQVEVRINTTNNAITDGSGTRALKRGEIQALMRTIEQEILRNASIPQ